jgi:uncharacterized protein YdaU (DUF1376 family)
MTERPWLPLYIADYLADTAHLSASEHGAYLLLIMHYWRIGRLPCDERQLARIARMTAREWANARDTIASFFDEDWRHKRVESELAKMVLKSNARAESGSRGGKAKALKNNKAGLANATILTEQNSWQKSGKSLPSSSDSKIQNTAASLRSAAAWRDLGEVLCEAAGITDATKTAGLLSLSEPNAWLQQGCDLELDILPTLRAIAARGKPFRSWTYCSKAVLEARDNRLSGSTVPVGATAVSAVAAKPHRNATIIQALERIAQNGIHSFEN